VKSSASPSQDNFYIVLIEPRYEGNVGGVARVMKNFGFRNLVLVNPCKLDKEARQKAMHGLDILKSAKHYKDFAELASEFDFLVGTTAKTAGDGNVLRTPVYPEELRNALDKKGKIALLFGREDYGLVNEEIDVCDMLVTIPADPDYTTLNLTQSVGIILYEMKKEQMKLKNSRKKLTQLDADRKRVLLSYYDQVVDGILDQKFNSDLSKKTFRQLIGRAFISGREASTLIGLFRRTSERLKRGG